MKLEEVQVRGFRCVDDVTLESCSGFNVLIGKNNSGKSSIMAAIKVFFDSINDGVVNVSPPIGDIIDFHQKQSNRVIEIQLSFLLSLAERDELVQNIVAEASQMRNAIEGIDASLRLHVALTIVRTDKAKYCYVNKITVCGVNTANEKTILFIDPLAASELAEEQEKSRLAMEDMNGLSQLMERLGDFPVRFNEGRTVRGASSMLARVGVDVSRKMMSTLEEAWGKADSLELFGSAVKALIDGEREKLEGTESRQLSRKIRTFAGEETTIPNYVKEILKRISQLSVLYLTERRKLIGKEEAEQLLSLKIERGGEEVLNNIRETVFALLGVKIDAFRDKDQKLAELDVDDFLVEMNGSGVREALRMILDVEFQKPDILLVEEPEIYLHPALEISIMRYLRKQGERRQVFISTHSTNFLDSVGMSNVYLVTKKGLATQISLIGGQDWYKIPSELGIRLSSIFMYDRLTFVEGPSDEAVFREWASKLGVNLSEASVGFVHMKGVRNFAYYANEATLALLSRRQVKMLFLIDKDERDDEDVKKLEKTLCGHATLEVLKKRELENYLLIPQAIVKLINKKKGFAVDYKGDGAPNENEIRKALESSLQKLKSVAIERRVINLLARPLYLSRKRLYEEDKSISVKLTDELNLIKGQADTLISQIEDVILKCEKEVELLWADGRQDIVPGDLVLDSVLSEYGLAFHKECDGLTLAGFMDKGDIDQEFIRIITEIGKI